jgi:IPT/TIG domain
VAFLGAGGAPSVALARQLPSNHSLAAVPRSPLSSPPPPVLPDDLTAFAGSRQAQAIQSFGTDQELTPPDPDIAVGSTDVVEVMNSAVSVLSRTGTTLAYADLNTFMHVPSGYHSSNPKVIYDGDIANGSQGRFWITVTEVPNSLAGCPHAEPVLIALSPPSSPLPFGDWLVYALPTGLDTPGTMLGDAPSLSVANDIVTVTFDDFSCSLNFLGSEIDVLQKTDLISDTGANPLVFFYDGPFAPQPVQPSFEPGTIGGPISIVTNESDCGAVACTNPEVEIDFVSGDPEAGNVVLTQGFDAMSPTAVDSSTGLLPPAQQEGTAQTLQTNDDRFLNAVLTSSGDIWAADGTECIPPGDTVERACLDYVEIYGSPVLQINNVGVVGADLYYPSVNVDAAGDLFTAFEESSTTMFPTMMDSTLTDLGYPPVLSSFQTLHASSTYYNADDLVANACGSGGCPWGDYSAAAQDPLDPNDVWVASATADGAISAACTTVHACWNTYVDQLTVSPPTINSVTPNMGPIVGGQTVTVDGFDFGSETTATLAGSSVPIHNRTPYSFTFVTPPAAPTGGTVQIQATNAFGSSSEGFLTSYLYEPLSNFVPVRPYRILDTRSDPFGPLGPGGIRVLPVIDFAPIPYNATAVVLNVTAVSGTAASLLSIYPEETPRPSTSNLNFAAHTVVANLVTVDLGMTGFLNIYNALGTVNVLADLEGYFMPEPASDLQGLFHPITPVRVCDTRTPTSCDGHAAVGPGKSIVVTVASVGRIPADGTAEAAVVNLTGVAGSASTLLSVFPTSSTGTCTPTQTSTINLLPGVVRANRVMVELGPSTPGGPADALCVFNAAGTINVIVDANGWFGSATATASPIGYQFQPVVPTRICDTRVLSMSCTAGDIGPGGKRLITVAGHAGVPAFGTATKVVAIIANLTAVAPSIRTYLTLYPAQLLSPSGVSDVNLEAGAVVPNLSLVELDTIPADAHDGDVDLYNGAGSVNAIIDLVGWFQ